MSSPIARHEAGHFLAHYLLRGVVAPVLTIRKAPGYDGACIGLDDPLPTIDHPRAAPVFLADPWLRSDVEGRIVALLAGEAAEGLGRRRGGGWEPEPEPTDDAARAAALARSLAELYPRDLELLRAAEAAPADGPAGTDGVIATSLSASLVPDEAGLHVVWLSAVARRFVVREQRAIAAVAAELERRTVLDGDTAAAIVDRARGEAASERIPA